MQNRSRESSNICHLASLK